MNKIKVLHCVIGSMNVGGIENMLMQIYRNIDREKFAFDFVVHDKKQNFYEEEINRLGGKLYRVDYLSKNPINHIKQFYSLLKSHTEYQIIHIHTTYSIMFIDALLSRCLGRYVIVHSHNNNASKKRKKMHYLFKLPQSLLANAKIACSDLAAEWQFMFWQQKQVDIWPNALELDKFKFDQQKRIQIREQYDATDKYIIGNVGRLTYQKNQLRLINLFNHLFKTKSNAELWLIGDGEDRKYLESKVKELELSDRIKFLGEKDNIEDYLTAMDLFVLTSRYEGLGIVLVEAQASGVPTLSVAENIPRSVKVTENLKFVENSQDLSNWIEVWETLMNQSLNREVCFEQINDSEYNISSMINRIETFYSTR